MNEKLLCTFRHLIAYLVFGYVDQQLGLEELLQDVLGRHVGERLLGRRRHAHLHHDDRPRDVLLLHTLTVVLHRFDADLRLVREEDEHLVWSGRGVELTRVIGAWR